MGARVKGDGARGRTHPALEAPGLTECRLEREAHFRGGVFFGLNVFPKRGIVRAAGWAYGVG